MQSNSPPHKHSILCAAISLSLLPFAGSALAQEQQEVEEVVVTGSYIRRSEGFIGASSVTQLNAEDLVDEGTLNIGEVIQNLTIVNGAASAITNTIQGTDSRSTTIDLRGLGARSTLTLLDGKRLVNENVNILIPTIAIQRIDIVADGASALYGSEAVAGVVNFVPFNSYDGLKIDTFAEQDSRGDYDEHSVQVLWGGGAGDVDLVLAGQFRSNSRLGWDERDSLANAGLNISSNAPGNWYVPERDSTGAYTGPTVASANRDTDPNCAPASERTGYTPNVIANPFGNRLGVSCFFDFGDTRSYREPTDTTQLFGNATWDYSDDLTFSLQGFYTRQYELRFTSTSNPGNGRIGELPAVRGDIPGNPFRAVAAGGMIPDPDNPGEMIPGPDVPIFGIDRDGDGLPDRQDGVDVNQDGWDDYVVLGTDGGAAGAIPLYEDVVARTLRPINKTHTRPSGHSLDMDNTSPTYDRVGRYSLQADFNVPMLEGWEGTASYTYNYRELAYIQEQLFDITAMIDGVNCDVINDRDSCYNPFFVTDQANNNTLEVMDAVAARGFQYQEDKLGVIDVVLTGELGGFELPGGAIGMAVGYQHRDESYTATPSPIELAGDTWLLSPEKGVITGGNREADAYFMEFAIPLLSSLELDVAVRQETLSTGESSTDPKFGVTWGLTDWLTLRATTGDAFIAPELSQQVTTLSCGLDNLNDLLTSHAAWTTSCRRGNPNLQNEFASSKQFGMDVNFDNFGVSVTWNETDFENRIVTRLGSEILREDFAAFQEATGFEGDGSNAANKPTEAQVAAWIANPLSSKDILRDPNDLNTILQINISPRFVNAESVKVEAMDIQANYTLSTGWGDFRFSLEATNILHFYYQGKPTDPVRDAAGLYNDVTGAAPELPEWKANLRMGWTMGNHSVVSTVHYVDAMPYDGPVFAHIDFFGGTYRPKSRDADGNFCGIADCMVKAWTDMDIAYTYRGLRLLEGEGAVSVGFRNVFDREAQPSAEFAGVIGALQDPMGRSIYARFVYDF
ncbi:MAG: TonB-dependent receptor domain-containing protein [Pseudohongiellaceae bacterium]